MITELDFCIYLGIFGTLVVSALTVIAYGVGLPNMYPIGVGAYLVALGWEKPDTGMFWWIMGPICIGGVLIHDLILYRVGRQSGAKILQKNWVQRHFSAEQQACIERNLQTHGAWNVVIARLGVCSPFLFLAIGLFCLPFGKFLLVDLLSSIVCISGIFGFAVWFTLWMW